MNCMAYKAGKVVCTQCGVDDSRLPDEPQALSPRTILNGKYVIGRLLGSGGFGNTYLAADLLLSKKLAIKEFLPQGLATRSNRQSQIIVYSGERREQFRHGLAKFLEEARTLARFSEHPGIVSILDFFQDNQTAYIMMEYVDGVTLKDYVAKKGGRIPILEALEIMRPVMDALREVHGVGVLHRDVSPDNIYITKNKQVKLLDFGAARHSLGDVSSSLSVILKPGYAPSEQYSTRGRQGPWTDVYAVAATLYAVVTGVLPDDAMARMEEDALRPIGEKASGVPAEVERALMIGLAVRVAGRWQTIAEFQRALYRAEVEPASAVVSGTETTGVSERERKRKRELEPGTERGSVLGPSGSRASDDRRLIRDSDRKSVRGGKRKWLIIMLSMVAVMTVALVSAYFVFQPVEPLSVPGPGDANQPVKKPEPKSGTIGDYVGAEKDVNFVKQDLLAKGYREEQIQVSEEWDKQAKGVVVRQSLTGGSVVDTSKPVLLTVSKGPLDLKIGDYVQFGMYYGKPIKWRVIHEDGDGNPVLFSDKILTIKAFDAAGIYHKDWWSRLNGSNNYENSNLRQWLNSDERTIKWTQNPPIKENMWSEYNPYADEEGFIADGNFTSNERSMIKTFTHRVLLSDSDKDQREGGKDLHINTDQWDMPDKALTNYDSAYYKNISDKVFLLSVKQLKEWVYDQRRTLGESWFIGEPTAEAVSNSTYKQEELKEYEKWYYSLNSPSTASSVILRGIDNDGDVGTHHASYGYTGVRPALQLDLSAATFNSDGDGSAQAPYIVASQ